MKLERILAKLPEQALDHFRKVHGAGAGAGSGETLDGPDGGSGGNGNGRNRTAAERTAGILAAEPMLRQAADRAKPWVRQVLKAAVREFGTLPFEQAALEKAALQEGTSGAHVRAALGVLRRQGLVFAFRKSWGEEVFLIPEDVLPVWHKLLFPMVPEPLDRTAVMEAEPFGNAGCAAYDILYAVQTAAEAGIKTVRTGGWPKPAQRRLESGLLLQDEDLAAAPVRLRQEGAFGPAAAVVLDLAVRAGLLAVREERWTVRAENLKEWLSKPLSRVQGELYGLWSEAAGPVEAWELHALAALGQAEAGSWYQLDQLFEWLRDCGMINGIAASGIEGFLESRLLPMQALGWIRLARLPGGAAAYQIPFPVNGGAAGEAVCSGGSFSGIIVQPDLEIVVPPYPPLTLLWDIMQWAEPVSRGELSVYRLTKDSVRRGAERGFQASGILETLDAASAVPVDRHVADSIRDWCGGHRASIRAGVTLLQVNDPAVCAHLESHEVLQNLVTAKLGEGLYELGQQAVEPVCRELERLGIATLRESGGGASGLLFDGEPDEDGEAPSILALRSGELPYPPAPVGGKEAEADWSGIPAAWWKAPGAYHPSTQKEILRLAIDRKAPVRLSDGEGNSWDLIPLALQEASDRWGVTGIREGERITVRPGDWQDIKLILPGVSE